MGQVGRRRAARPTREAWFWRSVAVRVAAVVGAVCLVTAGVLAATGATAIVVRGGSMAPAISSGDVAVARVVPATEIESGDIVSVVDRSGRRVTHRVVGVDPFGSSIRLTLKADANAAPDAETYTVPEVERIVLTVPLAGHLIGPLNGLPAMLVGAGCVACLAFVVVTRSRRAGGTRRATGTPRP